MRKLRTGNPTPKELWDIPEIMNYLQCDEMKARHYFEGYHKENGGGYGPVEKALMLDYIERKQREERERETRYQSDLANVESIAILKEQVKTLKEQVCIQREQIVVLRESSASSSKDALKARVASYIANTIAIASLIVAILSIIL